MTTSTPSTSAIPGGFGPSAAFRRRFAAALLVTGLVAAGCGESNRGLSTGANPGTNTPPAEEERNIVPHTLRFVDVPIETDAGDFILESAGPNKVLLLAWSYEIDRTDYPLGTWLGDLRAGTWDRVPDPPVPNGFISPKSTRVGPWPIIAAAVCPSEELVPAEDGKRCNGQQSIGAWAFDTGPRSWREVAMLTPENAPGVDGLEGSFPRPIAENDRRFLIRAGQHLLSIDVPTGAIGEVPPPPDGGVLCVSTSGTMYALSSEPAPDLPPPTDGTGVAFRSSILVRKEVDDRWSPHEVEDAELEGSGCGPQNISLISDSEWREFGPDGALVGRTTIPDALTINGRDSLTFTFDGPPNTAALRYYTDLTEHVASVALWNERTAEPIVLDLTDGRIIRIEAAVRLPNGAIVAFAQRAPFNAPRGEDPPPAPPGTRHQLLIAD